MKINISEAKKIIRPTLGWQVKRMGRKLLFLRIDIIEEVKRLLRII